MHVPDRHHAARGQIAAVGHRSTRALRAPASRLAIGIKIKQLLDAGDAKDAPRVGAEMGEGERSPNLIEPAPQANQLRQEYADQAIGFFRAEANHHFAGIFLVDEPGQLGAEFFHLVILNARDSAGDAQNIAVAFQGQELIGTLHDYFPSNAAMSYSECKRSAISFQLSAGQGERSGLLLPSGSKS